MSGYSEAHLRSKLEQELEPEFLEVRDVSDGCGGKFECVIGGQAWPQEVTLSPVSSKFEGKPLLARHRLVNTALEEELKTIHAFRYLAPPPATPPSQKTLTPEQWKAQQAA